MEGGEDGDGSVGEGGDEDGRAMGGEGREAAACFRHRLACQSPRRKEVLNRSSSRHRGRDEGDVEAGGSEEVGG